MPAHVKESLAKMGRERVARMKEGGTNPFLCLLSVCVGGGVTCTYTYHSVVRKPEDTCVVCEFSFSPFTFRWVLGIELESFSLCSKCFFFFFLDELSQRL